MNQFDPAFINTLLSILILINTLFIIFGVSAVSLMMVSLSTKLGAMTDIRQSISELTKVMEQNTRLLEYIGKR